MVKIRGRGLGPRQDLYLTGQYSIGQRRLSSKFLSIFEPTISWPDGSQTVHGMSRAYTAVSRFKRR